METLSRIGRKHTLMTKLLGLIWNQVSWSISSTPRETQGTCYLHQTGVRFGQMVPELVQHPGSGPLLGPSLLMASPSATYLFSELWFLAITKGLLWPLRQDNWHCQNCHRLCQSRLPGLTTKHETIVLLLGIHSLRDRDTLPAPPPGGTVYGDPTS